MKKSTCEKLPGSRTFYAESPPTGGTCVAHGFGTAMTISSHVLTTEQIAEELAKGNSVDFKEHP